jgi:exportin-2 (importin alpha re-exporter)
MRPVIMTLLTRMQTSRTATYEYLFARFFLFSMALSINDLGPDYIITVVEGIQPQYVV